MLLRGVDADSRFGFDAFELDSRRGVLLCAGTVAKLQPQPFRVLQYLLAQAPAVVSREELGEFVWGGRGVHVELDQSLNYCVRQIRQVLGDSATEPRYVETLPRQGYRFIGRLHEVGELEGAGLAGSAEVVEAGGAAVDPPEAAVREGGGVRRWARLLAAGGMALLAGAAVWGGLRLARHGGVGGAAAMESPMRAIAVMPLVNRSGDKGQDYVAEGMTDELMTELARIPNLRVLSRGMAQGGAPDGAGVDAVLTGAVARAGDTLRITAQLVDARTKRSLWAESFEGRLADVLSLENGVANEVALRARAALLPGSGAGEAWARQSAGRALNPVAHDAVLRGLYFYDKREARQSAVYFQKAIDAGPEYAPGYVGMANAIETEYLMGMAGAEGLSKGMALSRRAMQLDPADGEAYTVLGSLQTLAWDFRVAEGNLRRGLELSPSSSLGEMKYAVYLDVTRHPEEAITHMRRALQLDPVSFLMNRHLGSTLYFGRHYDEALEQLGRAKEMEPDRPQMVDNWMGYIYEMKGMQGEAVERNLASLGAELPGMDVGALREVYRARGWTAFWQARMAALERRPTECMAYERGMNAMRQGDRAGAFAQLGMAADQHCFWMMWSPVDPLLDDLRGDDRFQALLLRMRPGPAE